MSRRRDWEKANRKEIVHEQGGEPVWHDFPDQAPSWVREEFGDDAADTARPPARTVRRAKGAGAPANRYVCSRCRLEFGRSQFPSLHPPVCRDCS